MNAPLTPQQAINGFALILSLTHCNYTLEQLHEELEIQCNSRLDAGILGDDKHRLSKLTAEFHDIATLVGIPQELQMPLNDLLYIREDGETTVPITYLQPDWFRWDHNFQDGHPIPWSAEMTALITTLRPLADRLHDFSSRCGITHLTLLHTPSLGNFQSPHLPL